MFSRRLDWLSADNPLCTREQELRAAGVPLIDLTVSNPTAVGLPDHGSALAAALADPQIAAYQPSPLGPVAARALIAADYARLGGRVTPEQIVLSASSSESYAWLFKLLCDPGDAIVVPEPSYPLFEYLGRLEGVQVRRYRLVWAGHWQIDERSLGAALPGARAIIIVNPNNPTGSFLKTHELSDLAARAAAHDAALVVDEVFASYADELAADAVVTVTAAPALPALTFALGGLSKGAGLPQLKLGWLAALGPPALVAAALDRLETIADAYLSVGAPVLCALPRLLNIGAAVRSDIAARVACNRNTLRAALTTRVPVTWLPAEGGWSAILRVPAVRSDEEWALLLLESDRVVVQPGYFFDLDGAGAGTTLVVSLLTEPGKFAAGIAALIARAEQLVAV